MGLRILKKLTPFLIATAILIVMAVFSDTGLCVFRRATGLPCPSCGMTRAYSSLFSGDIRKAFFMHPLFLLVPVMVFLVIYSHYKKKDFTKTYIVLFVLFIAVYIIRMIFLFPHTYPFDYEKSSLLGRIIFF
jgi:hypothetical protein